MKLIFSQDSWILDELHPVERDFLEKLPDLAGGKDDAVKGPSRLLPDPVDDASGTTEEAEEIRADWKELVRPELESAFSEARKQVADDLKRVEQAESSEEKPPVLSRLQIPNEHTESWYSTLNQARLLLNETHDIAGKTEQFYRGDLNPENDADYLILLAQYEFFTAIQSNLIENRMNP